MLDQARRRVTAKGWNNVELVHARAADFQIPANIDAVFSAFALTLEPLFDEVIGRAAAAIAPGGRFVLLDLRMPTNWLRHLGPLLIRVLRPFAVSLEVARRQPWTSMQRHFPRYSYREGYFGIVYIAVGKQAKPQSR
jgi:ubiquinone/menaquinone biosynthesis C-methylase UbiE